MTTNDLGFAEVGDRQRAVASALRSHALDHGYRELTPRDLETLTMSDLEAIRGNRKITRREREALLTNL